MPTAGEVMTMARSLLNDQLGAVFTNAVQIPYLNMALRDLSQKLQLNDVPVTMGTSAVIPVPAGIDNIGGAGGPALPPNFVNAKQLFQRQTGTNDPFYPIEQEQFKPHWTQEGLISQVTAWAYLEQVIHLVPSTLDMDIKIDYTKSIIPDITEAEDLIEIINCHQFLGFKTAGYCAYFIGENPTRAEILAGQAEVSFNEMLGIETKGQQSIVTRRRPFRAAWKQRGWT